MANKNVWLTRILGFYLCTGLIACTSTAYKAPISQFNDAATLVAETSRAYITQVNKVEREKYIDEQLANREDIKLDDITKKVILTPDEIEVRVNSINQLTRFGALLLKVANSDAPESIAQSAEGLGKALEKLDTDVSEKLGRPENNSFKAAIGPVTTIIGEIGKYAAQQKIQKALDEAVIKSAKPVQNLLKVLSTETELAYERKRSHLSNMRVIVGDEYAKELHKGKAANVETLKTNASQLKSQLDDWDSLIAARPQESIAAMADAYNALVAYSQSEKRPKDLSDFITEMETFLDRAKKVGFALKKLIDA